MKQAIRCNLLCGKPISDINACLDKSGLTIKNIEVMFITFEDGGGSPKMCIILDWDIFNFILYCKKRCFQNYCQSGIPMAIKATDNTALIVVFRAKHKSPPNDRLSNTF